MPRLGRVAGVRRHPRGSPLWQPRASTAACAALRTRGWASSLLPSPALLGPINGGEMAGGGSLTAGRGVCSAFPQQPRRAKMAVRGRAGRRLEAGEERGRWRRPGLGGGARLGGGRAGSMAARRPRLRTRGPSSLGLRALRVRERHRHRHRHGRACGDHRPRRR